MLLRLWWKEWRSLAPIMATLVIAAGALHWFLLTYGGKDVRTGILIPIAVGFAVVYALVAGAASFAGERENRTMGFLDALPVGRSMLWLGKASFALVSSVLLGLLLRWGSSIGWVFEDKPFTPIFDVDLFFGLLLVEAAIWGLLWSSLTKNALTAGILGVLTTGASTIVQGLYFATREPGQVSSLDISSLTLWVGLLGVVLLISWAVLELELPIRLRPRTGERGVAPSSLRSVLENPLTLRELFRPGPAILSVAWQTVREGRTTWLQTLGIGLTAPLLGFLAGGRGVDLITLMVLCSVALLVQGASVFGLENSAGTRHFLDNQAVPPGTVWVAKVATWAVGLVGFIMIVAVMSFFSSPNGPFFTPFPDANLVLTFAAVAALPNAFAVGMLGGMIFTRRITAAMISLMALVVVVTPQVALLSARMVPLWGLALTPLILVGVSRFWAGDWLANRSGARPWFKLATLIVVPLGVLISAYVASRALGVSDVGPQFAPTTQTVVSPKLAGAYRDALSAMAPDPLPGDLPEFLDKDWSDVLPGVVECWKNNLKAIELTRQAAARPINIGENEGPSLTQQFPVTSGSIRPSAVASGLTNLSTLLATDSKERRSRGDFVGAWNDILAQFQVSDHYANAARSMVDYNAAMQLSQTAMNRAMTWSLDPKVTVEAIRSARASLGSVAMVPTAAESLRGESRKIEENLDRPTEDWVEYLSPSNEANPFQPWSRINDAWIVAPKWERERARRIIRMVSMMAISNAGLSRSGRLKESSSIDPFWPPSNVGLDNTPLANRLVLPFSESEVSYDRELTNRRALEVFLALRAWQLTHNGNAPASLEELLPSELTSLANDPYSTSNLVFRYRDTRGEIESLNANESSPPPTLEGLPGGMASAIVPARPMFRSPHYLLYSVGPNHRDDGGRSIYDQGYSGDDVAYLLPANPPPQPK